MNGKITIAIVVLLLVVILGGILIAWPQPAVAPTGDEVVVEPFVSENVKVASPLPEATVSKTFTVSGEARGWYFEASFPIQVRDPSNALIAEAPAQAQSDWMTEDWVPFKSTITVSNYSGPAVLVLMKDNPSGLPENADAVEFPILIQ